jgi:hypothetical protein
MGNTGVTLSGTIVETEAKPWDFNGRQGTAHSIFVRAGSARDGAKKVKVGPEQFESFSEGEDVELPVAVYARTSDYGGPARIEYVLDAEYQHNGSGFGRPTPLSSASMG